MTKSDIIEMPVFFDRYINLVPDIPINDALKKFGRLEDIIPLAQLEALGDNVYQPGKWTIKESLQHLIDTERILAYRALRFARKDQTPLAPFDEEAYAKNAPTENRTISDLLYELHIVRESTILMFNSFSPETLQFTGTASNKKISVLALGFTITGHLLHHAVIIRERYLPLILA